VLEVVTWAAEILGPRAVRAYEVYRHGQAASEVGTVTVPADGLLPATHVPASEPLVRARTQWVYVDLASSGPPSCPYSVKCLEGASQKFSFESRNAPA
jgi:acyl-CoA thioesterase FadM